MCPGLDKSTLDTNTCYRDDNGCSNLLLLIMEVVLVYDGVEYSFNALIDSGNVRSYLADSLLNVLNCKANKLPTRKFVMKTFLGSARKRLQELKLPDCVYSIPFLVDKNVDLTFKVKELSNAVFDMQASGCKLAADFLSVHEDTVSVVTYVFRFVFSLKKVSTDPSLTTQLNLFWFLSLFSGISTFVGYLMPKPFF